MTNKPPFRWGLRNKARIAGESRRQAAQQHGFTINTSNKSRFGALIASLTACLCSLCSGSAHSVPPSADLQTLVERQARDKQICAVSYATIHEGKISSSGGASGCNHRRTPTGDSVFQAASLGKPVFAYAVLKLAQEGSLNLDAPVVSYLPQGYMHAQNPFAFGQPPITNRVVAPELSEVTARMVLKHTSGLPNWSSDSLAFDFKPGAGWQYSGEGFMLLQRVVESITNEKLDDFMRHRLFDPLAMSNTAFRWQPRFADAFMPGMPQYIEFLSRSPLFRSTLPRKITRSFLPPSWLILWQFN